MILYKKVLLKYPKPNTLVLEGKAGGDNYFYVSKATYNQAAMLNTGYSSVEDLARAIGVIGKLWIVTEYVKAFPEPLNVLVPFVLLHKNLRQTISVEYICSILHQMSTVINFVSYTRVPADIRANFDISEELIDDYTTAVDLVDDETTLAESTVHEIVRSIISEIGIKEDLTGICKITSLIDAQLDYMRELTEKLAKFEPKPVIVEQPVGHPTRFELGGPDDNYGVKDNGDENFGVRELGSDLDDDYGVKERGNRIILSEVPETTSIVETPKVEDENHNPCTDIDWGALMSKAEDEVEEKQQKAAEEEQLKKEEATVVKEDDPLAAIVAKLGGGL